MKIQVRLQCPSHPAGPVLSLVMVSLNSKKYYITTENTESTEKEKNLFSVLSVFSVV